MPPQSPARIFRVPRGHQPLPIRDGLNPSRVRLPDDSAPLTAAEFLRTCIETQRYRHPEDNEQALLARFAQHDVVIGPRFHFAQPDDLVQPGEDLWFYRIPAPESPVPYECEIVHEDAHILVIHKPHFLATMPRSKHITETATVRMRRMTGINELAPAHRLDRLTAGLLLFTKQRKLRGAYQNLFSNKLVTKTYEAISTTTSIAPGTHWHSRILKEHGTICSYEAAGEPNAHTEVLAVEPLGCSLAVRLQQQHDLDNADLARYILRPHTGKTHQLRVHMNSAHAPILGDPFYPVVLPEDVEDMRIPMHLTSIGMEFIDPISGKPRKFSTHGTS
ncbi:MAG: pseudouridine synthase [Corynebacterium sp.]|nr:pseudouridine synthase [Corynebacterium sp.]